MFATLLRRWASVLPLFLLMFLAGGPAARASHYLGGEMSYRYLGANGVAPNQFRYEVTLLLYRNAYAPDMPAAAPPTFPLSMYVKDPTGTGVGTNIQNADMPRINISGTITPPVVAGCATGGVVRPFQLAVYQLVVSLPFSTKGYYAVASAAARNYGITNLLANANNQRSLTLYLDIAPPTIPNSSPVFSDTAVAVICQGDTSFVLNNAADADGDRLVYAFGTPGSQTIPNAGGPIPTPPNPLATFTPPPTPIPYNPTYSVTQPFGPGGFISLNANTGLARYRAPTMGLYVIAVDVSEYRVINGVEVLIGKSRRDIQLVAQPCPANSPPNLPPSTGTGNLPRNYTIEEGASVTIPFRATDSPTNPLVLKLNSVLLDGRNNGFDASLNGDQGILNGLTGTASVTGTGTVTGNFVYNSHCGEARATPYDIVTTVQDRSCGGTTIADVFRITVNKPAAPTGITGTDNVCDPATVRTYTAVGPAPGQAYNWHITNGSIVSGQSTNTVTVRFASAVGTSVVSLKYIGAFGCPSDSVLKNVLVRPVGTLTLAAANATLCGAGTTTLTLTGPAGLTYTLGGQPVTVGTPVTVNPTATTTYTLTGVDPVSTCSATATATVTVVPVPVANAGPDRAFCAGGSAQLGVAPVAGITYSWAPTTGLSNATVANPTVTLATAGTYTYTLTATAGPGCATTDQVTVTVNPAAVANAGPARATCSGVPTTLGAGTAATGFTYTWTPATDLSSATAAQPVATIANLTGVPFTRTYTLTVASTTVPVCSATSTVAVTVNPAAVATPVPTLAFCAGASATLTGTAAVAGTTYSWTPTTGLSSATVANPTLTLPTAGTFPYTLTATTALGCVATGTTVVTVNPLPVANAGPDAAACGTITQVLGSPAVTGNTYAWTPATGLSNATAAQPTVTLTNPSVTMALVTTYTLTVTSGQNCVNTDQVVVTVNPGTINPTPTLSLCSGVAGVLGGATPVAGATYSWTPTTGLSDPTVISPTITLINTTGAATTTTYTLTAVNPASLGGCTVTATVVVTVNPQPVANPGPAVAFCAGGSVQLGVAPVTGYTYAWTPTTGLNNPNTANPTLTLPNPGTTVLTTTYTLTVSSLTTPVCTNQATVAVTVNPQPVALPGPAVAFCAGGSATLGTPAIAGYTYSWTPATGLNDPTVAQPTVTLTTPGTFTYSLTVGSGTTPNCTNTATVAVTVNPIPVANAGTNQTVCSGLPAQLGAAPVAGLTYSWTPTTGLSSATVANPTATLTNTGPVPVPTTYTLTVSSTTTPICTNMATVSVTVNPAAVATPGPAVSFCSGGSVQIGVAPIAGTTYLYSPATGLSDPTASNPTVTGTNNTASPVTTTYTLTATTANGCTATGTVAVTINPAAVAVPGTDRSVCSGLPTPLGAAPVAGYMYSWTPATDLSSATAANPVATIANPGPGNIVRTYTLTVTNAQGCVNMAPVTVTVFPAAVATPGPAVAFCSGASAQIGAPAVPGYTYGWTPTTGLSSATAAQPTVTGTNTTNAPVVTTYTLTATTADGCTATGTVAVTINPAALANAGANLTLCSGLTGQLGAAVPATAAPSTYSWTPTTGLSSATSANPTVTLTNTTGAPVTTPYTLTVTTNAGSCTATATVAVTVNPAAVATPGPAVSFCSGGSAMLGGPAAAGYTYSWTPTTGLSSATSANPTVTLTNTTGAPITTPYTLTATTADGCVASATVAVTVNQAALANAGPAVAFCSGGSATLGVAPIAGTTYSYAPTTGLSNATASNPTVTGTNNTASPVTTTYTLTATTAQGCTATSTVAVTVNPAPIADAGPDRAICDGKRTTLGSTAQPGYTYAWTPATGLSSPTAAQPVFSGTNPTAAPIRVGFRLTATTSAANGGCAATDSVYVTVNPRPAADSISGPASVCPTVTNIAYTIRNPRATAYQWLVTGATGFTGNGTPAIAVNWGTAGTGTVKAFTLNPTTGCSSDTVTLPIRINQLLQTARPTGPNPVCQGGSPYTYQTVYANGSSYSWTIIGGTQVSTNLAAVVVNWNPVLVPTIGKLVVQETSNPASGIRCLGGSDTLRVTINPTPRATLAISGPANVCASAGTATFSLPGGFAGSAYAFTFDGNPVATTTNAITVAPLPAPGTYVVTARETSAQGCTGPVFSFSVTVNPAPVPLVVTGPVYLCNAAQAQQYSVPNTPGSTYQWAVTGGTVTAGQGTAQVTVQFDAAANAYTVTATETSAFGCGGSAATLAVRPDRPGLVLALASVTLTSNTSITLTLSAPNSGNTLSPIHIFRRIAGTGTFADIGTVPVNATSFTDPNVDAAANSYEYRLDLTNGCNTTVSSAIVQTIRLAATATAGTGGRNQGGTALAWNAYTGGPVSQYLIFRSDDNGAYAQVATVTGSTLATTIANTGTGYNQCFRIVAVDANGQQSNSNTSCVSFTNATAFYNVITPNHDGLNDALTIDNIQLNPGHTFTIFNRWGRQVYETTNYQNDWGPADDVAPGVYYYLLKLANGTQTKGWIEVIK